jgi:hypothetical protein
MCSFLSVASGVDVGVDVASLPGMDSGSQGLDRPTRGGMPPIRVG